MMQLILSLRLINPISPDGLIDFLRLLGEASCASSEVINWQKDYTETMKLCDELKEWSSYLLLEIFMR